MGSQPSQQIIGGARTRPCPIFPSINVPLPRPPWRGLTQPEIITYRMKGSVPCTQLGTQYLLNRMGCLLGKSSALCKQSNSTTECHRHPGHLSPEGSIRQKGPHESPPHAQCGKSNSTRGARRWENMFIYKSQPISLDFFFPKLHLEMQPFKKKIF